MRTVADAMASPAPLVERSATIQEASAAMLDAGLQAAVVVEDERVHALATAQDIASALAERLDATRTPVDAVARHEIATVRADEPLAEAHARMRMERHRMAVVVDADGLPIGLLEDPEAWPIE